MRARHLPIGPSRACVYVLLRHDRRRFKLGWSGQPLFRIRSLPEYARRELDVAASKAVWLPDRMRAEQVERSMHKTLAPYRVEPDHALDGNQEWFAGHAQDTALRLLGQMPLGESSQVTARIAPLSLPAPSPAAVSIDTGPQVLWWDIEDLLARLALHCPITIEAEPMGVRIHRLRVRTEETLRELRTAALDTDSWQCWREGRPLSFVQTLEWDGDDLLLRLMPLRQVERWDGGEELAWQVKGFLARLRRQALLREPAEAQRGSV